MEKAQGYNLNTPLSEGGTFLLYATILLQQFNLQLTVCATYAGASRIEHVSQVSL